MARRPLGLGSGFVFNTIRNVLPKGSVEDPIALVDARRHGNTP